MDNLRKYLSLYSSTANTFSTGEGVTITPTSVVGLPTDTEITLTFDRVDSSGTKTPSKMERIRGTIIGSNFVVSSGGRAVEGTEQVHTSPVVEMVWNASDWNDMADWALVEHNQDGTHKSSKVLPTSYLDTDGTLAANSDTKIASQKATKTYVADQIAAIPPSAAFWTAFTGAYASGTTITIAGVDMTGIFHKGVSIKWLSSADALKIGKVVSSSYSSPNTTITVVGSTVEADDKSFYYGADVMSETFIIAGNQSTGTNVSKTWTNKTPIYEISVDAIVSTAGTTNSTDYDLNIGGSTKITTKPSIASGATTDLDNVVDNVTTEVAVNSVHTVDIDAASTTQAIDGYVTLFFIPSWWINRT